MFNDGGLGKSRRARRVDVHELVVEADCILDGLGHWRQRRGLQFLVQIDKVIVLFKVTEFAEFSGPRGEEITAWRQTRFDFRHS